MNRLVKFAAYIMDSIMSLTAKEFLVLSGLYIALVMIITEIFYGAR